MPVLKMFTASESVRVISHGIECIGALGYMEDSGIPKLYRDAQVTTIWEGTSNVMALDFKKAAVKTKVQIPELSGLIQKAKTSKTG